MKELLDKITSYNLFNNLLPGVLYGFLFDNYIVNKPILMRENILVSAFVLYFIGLIISRIGSIIIEPILIKVKFAKYSEYKDYLSATAKDTKIELLLEMNNMYRTILSLLLLALFSKMYFSFSIVIGISETINFYVVIGLILILFLFSFLKQTNFIRQRIEKHKDK